MSAAAASAISLDALDTEVDVTDRIINVCGGQASWDDDQGPTAQIWWRADEESDWQNTGLQGADIPGWPWEKNIAKAVSAWLGGHG